LALAALVAVSLALHSACNGGDELQAEPQQEAVGAGDNLPTLVEEFLAAAFEARPPAATRLGRHEFDGRLPDWSESGLARWAAQLEAFGERARALEVPAGERPRRRQLVAVIERQLFWLQEARWPSRSISFYLEDLDPSPYLLRPYAPTSERMAAYVRFAAALPRALEQSMGHLDHPLPGAHVTFAEAGLRDLGEFMRRDAGSRFRSVEDPELWRRFDRVNAEAVEALRRAAFGFGARIDGAPVEGFALGTDLVRRMLWVHTGGLDLDLAELEAAGRQEVERRAADLASACEALRAESGTECREILQQVSTAFPVPALSVESKLAEVRRLIAELGLVELPTEGSVRVVVGPRFAFRGVFAMEGPGPFDTPFPPVLTVAREPGIREREEAPVSAVGSPRALLALARETWPGGYPLHELAGSGDDPLVRSFPDGWMRRGWTRYALEELAQRAFAPHDALGRAVAAQEETLSAVRLVAALGLHSGSFGTDEAERLFRERGLLSPQRARAEASRCARDPEQLGEVLAALAIRRMRQEWQAMRGPGGLDADMAFHAELLSVVGYPLAVARELLVPGVEGSVI
jgi:hypothetical protein